MSGKDEKPGKDNIAKGFMNFELTGIHMDVNEKIRDYFSKKLHRLEFASGYIIDLLFKIIKEKKGFTLESNFNLKWGNSGHVSVECFEILEGVDDLFDKIELKIKKEKTKIQDHKGKELNFEEES
jgi:putative sigma-54 modulation protein